MNKAQLEKLIIEVGQKKFDSLTEEERTALQQFKDCHSALRQVEAEKEVIRKQRQLEKRRGEVDSIALTTQEKALLANRRKRINADLKVLSEKHSEHDLQDRHDFEVSGTVWSIIDDYGNGEDWHVDHYTSRESLEHNMFNLLHVGASVKEVFFNGRRLTKKERDEFMAPMLQEEEDHRANSPFHQIFGH